MLKYISNFNNMFNLTPIKNVLERPSQSSKLNLNENLWLHCSHSGKEFFIGYSEVIWIDFDIGLLLLGVFR